MPAQINSIRDLAAAARGRRLSLSLSQAELASRARVSRPWISEFEAGKPTAELGLVLRLLDALALDLKIAERDDTSGGDQPPQRSTVDLDALLAEYRAQ
ncbi:MAG: helix-turn-helix domain-containing protein [Actinomycetota bacterium]|nr:helix-turn-helix domain-containing protein [Actinomycetota bacterium]